MITVLFACIHNAGRSQMAAAWFNALSDPSAARALSAGTEPGASIHPEVVDVMREAGIDLSEETPKFLSDELTRSTMLLVTMGCGEACPVVPGLRREDWPLEDPKGKPVQRVREIRDEVKARVDELLAREGWARSPEPSSLTTSGVDLHAITTHEALRAIIPDAKPATKSKVVVRLGKLEREFIGRAPLIFVATASRDGRVTVSPKGDGPGLAAVPDDGTLLIPERPGNGLAYGLSNLIDNPHVGIIFVTPGSTETLRVDGRVELTRDPVLLRKLAARGKDALLIMRVRVERCFFHCSKAFLRSGFWSTETWPEPFELSWGEWAKQWYDVPERAVKQIDADIAKDEVENL